MYVPKLTAKQRKQSMYIMAQIAAADGNKVCDWTRQIQVDHRFKNAGKSLDTNVNTKMERRNSLSKEEQNRNAERRKSMLAVTDIAKMQKMDSRQHGYHFYNLQTDNFKKGLSVKDDPKAGRKASFAAAAKAASAANKMGKIFGK